METSDLAPTYEPKVDTFAWLTIRLFVTFAVSDPREQTAYDNRQVEVATSRLIAWTRQEAGLPCNRRLVFALTTIEGFVDGCLRSVGLQPEGTRSVPASFG